ncbi:MAG: ABC transporter permease [Kineosporiaceae bacterium]
MSLVLLHTRYQVLETLRVPIAVVGTTVFPALSLLFFIAPQPFADDPVAATAGASQLAVFAVLSVCVFSYGVGVAEDRALPWDPYVRTLPAGPVPRLAGRLLTGLAFAILGLIPLVLLAWALTAATLEPARWPLAALALALSGTPLLFLGLAVGYALPTKAALAVAQILLLPLAFAGGLFLPPSTFPDWLDSLSLATPTRAARDLVVWATTGDAFPASTVPVLVAWTAVTAIIAIWAYQRDEGRRYR